MRLKLTCRIGIGLFILPFTLYAENQSYYCSQKHATINIGMTSDEVIAACGQPQSQQDSNQPVLKKTPVQQLIYDNIGTSTAFYGVWNLPTGTSSTQLEISIMNEKVRSIKLNGSETNAASLCQDTNIQVGDSVEKVYSACGTPSMVNESYVDELAPLSEKPTIWTYQPGEYQPTITLTFINGRLQSIQ